MSDFSRSKLLVIIGLINIPLWNILNRFVVPETLIPYISFIVSIVSFICILVGMKGLAEHYKDETIYRNTRVGVICWAISIFTAFGPINILNRLSDITSTQIALLALVVLIICSIPMAVYFRKVLRSLAEHSGKELFQTASTLMYIGAILTIILIGLFAISIALLCMLIALCTLKITDTKTKHCTHCGNPTPPENTFCTHCGNQLITAPQPNTNSSINQQQQQQ